ncbi:hypothetical protein SNEBB_003809 [Seison nebaliae]|nr:hypothetical protein SNEBB_003809 [Seison nebaliae]
MDRKYGKYYDKKIKFHTPEPIWHPKELCLSNEQRRLIVDRRKLSGEKLRFWRKLTRQTGFARNVKMMAHPMLPTSIAKENQKILTDFDIILQEMPPIDLERDKRNEENEFDKQTKEFGIERWCRKQLNYRHDFCVSTFPQLLPIEIIPEIDIKSKLRRLFDARYISSDAFNDFFLYHPLIVWEHILSECATTNQREYVDELCEEYLQEHQRLWQVKHADHHYRTTYRTYGEKIRRSLRNTDPNIDDKKDLMEIDDSRSDSTISDTSWREITRKFVDYIGTNYNIDDASQTSSPKENSIYVNESNDSVMTEMFHLQDLRIDSSEKTTTNMDDSIEDKLESPSSTSLPPPPPPPPTLELGKLSMTKSSGLSLENESEVNVMMENIGETFNPNQNDNNMNHRRLSSLNKNINNVNDRVAVKAPPSDFKVEKKTVKLSDTSFKRSPVQNIATTPTLNKFGVMTTDSRVSTLDYSNSSEAFEFPDCLSLEWDQMTVSSTDPLLEEKYYMEEGGIMTTDQIEEKLRSLDSSYFEDEQNIENTTSPMRVSQGKPMMDILTQLLPSTDNVVIPKMMSVKHNTESLEPLGNIPVMSNSVFDRYNKWKRVQLSNVGCLGPIILPIDSPTTTTAQQSTTMEFAAPSKEQMNNLRTNSSFYYLPNANEKIFLVVLPEHHEENSLLKNLFDKSARKDWLTSFFQCLIPHHKEINIDDDRVTNSFDNCFDDCYKKFNDWLKCFGSCGPAYNDIAWNG